jgi:hypothetical protein
MSKGFDEFDEFDNEEDEIKAKSKKDQFYKLPYKFIYEYFPTLSNDAIVLFIYFAHRVNVKRNNDTSTWPAYPTIMDDLGVPTPGRITDAIDELVECGLITDIKKKYPHKLNSSNAYFININLEENKENVELILYRQQMKIIRSEAGKKGAETRKKRKAEFGFEHAYPSDLNMPIVLNQKGGSPDLNIAVVLNQKDSPSKSEGCALLNQNANYINENQSKDNNIKENQIIDNQIKENKNKNKNMNPAQNAGINIANEIEKYLGNENEDTDEFGVDEDGWPIRKKAK